MLNKLERQAADVLKTKSLLRSEQELRQKLDKLDPEINIIFSIYNFMGGFVISSAFVP